MNVMHVSSSMINHNFTAVSLDIIIYNGSGFDQIKITSYDELRHRIQRNKTLIQLQFVSFVDNVTRNTNHNRTPTSVEHKETTL